MWVTLARNDKTWHPFTKSNCEHNKLLGDEQWIPVKTLWETAPSGHGVTYFFLKKEVVSHKSIWIEIETSAEVSNSSISKHKTGATRVLFLPLFSHRFVVLCIVGIRLVFDNNQRWPVPLNNWICDFFEFCVSLTHRWYTLFRVTPT